MKTKKSMDKLKQTEFEQLPAVRKFLSRVNDDRKYQGVKVLGYETGIEFKSKWIAWANEIEACLKDRLQTEHTDLLSSAGVIRVRRHRLFFTDSATSLAQGVVTTNSLVQPSATGIKVFDQRKYTLIA